jgi:hypothetical protein
MNMIEIWCSMLTKQQVRRGVCHDVTGLIAAIQHVIDGYKNVPNRSSEPRSRSWPRPSNDNALQMRRTMRSTMLPRGAG